MRIRRPVAKAGLNTPEVIEDASDPDAGSDPELGAVTLTLLLATMASTTSTIARIACMVVPKS